MPGTQVKGAYGMGDIQPPRNSTAPSADNRIMLAYSPRKNRPKVMAEYSVWKPATSSASDIGRSNGVRLVSAKGRDEEDDEHRQERQPEPVEEPARLGEHHLGEVERAD